MLLTAFRPHAQEWRDCFGEEAERCIQAARRVTPFGWPQSKIIRRPKIDLQSLLAPAGDPKQLAFGERQTRQLYPQGKTRIG